MENLDLSFWKGKKVLITGNMGFKGVWLSVWLQKLGAKVTGYSLPTPTNPSMFELIKKDLLFDTTIADVNNLTDLKKAIKDNEIVFHLAAQPIVKESYKNPSYTFQTNIMGTANLLEACRDTCVKAIVLVTTDKVYKNEEWVFKYRENDKLGGYDPYSCSKACAELIAETYRKSFGLNVATARAGNVIGGGDFAPNRLIPDIFRAISENKELVIRKPNATRPYQHVLDCLYGYLLLGQALYQDVSFRFNGAWNFAPYKSYSTLEVLKQTSVKYRFETSLDHEDGNLSLDSTKAKELLGWMPLWSFNEALNQTSGWYNSFLYGADLHLETLKEIDFYESSIRE